MNVEVQVFTREGTPSGRADFELGVGWRRAIALSELLEGAGSQAGGFIIIRSSGQLVAQLLFGDQSLNLLSAIPPRVIKVTIVRLQWSTVPTSH